MNEDPEVQLHCLISMDSWVQVSVIRCMHVKRNCSLPQKLVLCPTFPLVHFCSPKTGQHLIARCLHQSLHSQLWLISSLASRIKNLKLHRKLNSFLSSFRIRKNNFKKNNNSGISFVPLAAALKGRLGSLLS